MSNDLTNEANNVYVSSRGLMKICDYYSLTPKSGINQLYNYPDLKDFLSRNQNQSIVQSELSYTQCEPNCSSIKNQFKIPRIYVCSSAILDFINSMLPHINFRFVLVSGDCDEDMPFEVFNNELFDNFIKDDRLVHWYCQNWVFDSSCITNNNCITRSKVTIMPIGMDYHTMQVGYIPWGVKTNAYTQEMILNKMRENMKPFWERFNHNLSHSQLCYSNFHFLTNTKHGHDRLDAIQQIPKQLVYYEPEKVERLISWKKQIEFPFVISPHGGGFDCHRLWEALLLGCIPIVKKSMIDNLYERLPVLIVDEWSDITETVLINTIEEFKKKHLNNEFAYEKLTLQYWKNKIYS